MEGRSSTVAFSALEAIAQAHDFLVGLPLISSGKGHNVTKDAGPTVIVRKAQRPQEPQPRHYVTPTVAEHPLAPLTAMRHGGPTRAPTESIVPAVLNAHHHARIHVKHHAASNTTVSVQQASAQLQQQQQQQQQQAAPHASAHVQQQPNVAVMCHPWRSTPRAVPTTQPIPAVAAPSRIPAAKPVSPHRAEEPRGCLPSPHESLQDEAAAAPAVSLVLQRIKQLMQPTNMQEHQFYSDCYRACQSVGGLEDGSVSIPAVALALRVCGHRVVVRKVLDSKAYWTKAMTNMFCYSLLPGLEGGYIVEPNFRQILCTGFMTERYRDIWECLPAIFVGRAAQLASLVQLLCQEMAMSFEADERIVPPWRTYSASIIRWLSKAFTDIPTPPLPDVGGSEADARAVQRFEEKCEQLRAVDMASSARGSKTRWYRTTSGTWVSVDGAEGVCSGKPNLMRPALPRGVPIGEGVVKIVVARSGARRTAEVLLCTPSRTLHGFETGPASHPVDVPGDTASQPASGTTSGVGSSQESEESVGGLNSGMVSQQHVCVRHVGCQLAAGSSHCCACRVDCLQTVQGTVLSMS